MQTIYQTFKHLVMTISSGITLAARVVEILRGWEWVMLCCAESAEEVQDGTTFLISAAIFFS